MTIDYVIWLHSKEKREATMVLYILFPFNSPFLNGMRLKENREREGEIGSNHQVRCEACEIAPRFNDQE